MRKKKRQSRILAAFMAVSFLFATTVHGTYVPNEPKFEPTIYINETLSHHEFSKPIITKPQNEETEKQIVDEEIIDAVVIETPAPEFVLTDEEIELLALLTMAEAEAEPEMGQRLVIDTVLNRMASPYFPDTIQDVIYQKYQFSSMWNGRVERCYVRDDIVTLIKEETLKRTNTDVVFFRTQHYSEYGVPMFQVGHHYFSSYD